VAIPLILGWTITHHQRLGYFRGYKMLNGKLKYRYLSRYLIGAEDKLLHSGCKNHIA
jgi:hypothetical protein